MIRRAFSNHKQFSLIYRNTYSHRKQMFNLAVLSILLVFSSVLRSEETKIVISAEELKELVPKIEAAENAILDIKIESETWVETKTSLSDPCEQWQRTPSYHSHIAWAQKGPISKARVDVLTETFGHNNGSKKYVEQSFSVSFDGKHTKHAYHKRGPFGQTNLVRKGVVLAEVPSRLKNGNFDIGAYYSLPFFDAEIYKFSELFQLSGDPNSEVASELEFRREEFLGVQCIKITSESYGITYWLDPAKGFALRGKKSTTKYKDGHEELVKFVKVTRLEEVAKGLWWPVEVSVVSRPYEDGKPWQRFIYQASNVVANNSNFDESIFAMPFPEGYLIDDQVTGKKYRVGEKTEQK